ncbi:damage-inducible protein DinB [bacterium SCSIO 12643]|nr:damage-inducible protein DinB [bacterium SCSIO 12643]
MNALDYLSELEQEFVSTGHLLEILPEDHLTYKPHEKAMSLGQLALHVASLPGRNLQFAHDGQVETTVIVQHPIPENKQEILLAFEKSQNVSRSILETEKQEWLTKEWNLLRSQTPIATMPRSSFIRTFVLNHLYHHRGELATYLRTLDVALPSIYGPTADINPFA